jgi:DNA-binding NarL/FixJ family response regulator
MTSTNAPASNSAVGVLLMDESLHPVWFNMEAVRILGYPQKPDSPRPLSADALGEKIRASLSKQSLRSPSLTELNSSRRRYLCRAFRMEPQGKANRGPRVAVLLERSPRALVTLPAMCAQYQFTRREQETLELLSDEFDTKDIANSLGISVNTAKVYIRMVMAKMGVSSRREILSRILSMKPSGPNSALATEPIWKNRRSRPTTLNPGQIMRPDRRKEYRKVKIGPHS